MPRMARESQKRPAEQHTCRQGAFQRAALQFLAPGAQDRDGQSSMRAPPCHAEFIADEDDRRMTADMSG